MNLQWYPGHMAKTRRLIEENVKLIDVVVEIMDARVPVSSRNPDFDVFFTNKPRIALLNKTDLADAAATEKWAAWYRARGVEVICINALAGKGTEKIVQTARALLKDRIERDAARGGDAHRQSCRSVRTGDQGSVRGGFYRRRGHEKFPEASYGFGNTRRAYQLPRA